ncbi:hypothetical protein JL475_37295 [Streptomyces sp. M2CJ-2]|uniref:hypothetical protein n=1 Tax=Streptomyces sp. M2CJ-2 TaxID=2803948 RepID=UPI001928050E|nr:hypothetical protein [Streptomyces sp. M2CJ-2]MBL3671451.1 hypothetical protein [Streptomyces sp. M2CJ-2]
MILFKRVISTATVLLAALGAGIVSPTAANASTVACNQNVEVRESDWDVYTGCFLQYGDTVQIGAQGSIWAGVWFTGNNGPQGWTNTAQDPKFPMPSARAYSLLSRADGRYRYVGTGTSFLYTGSGTYLYLRINDDVPGNGNGSFNANVQVIR